MFIDSDEAAVSIAGVSLDEDGGAAVFAVVVWTPSMAESGARPFGSRTEGRE